MLSSVVRKLSGLSQSTIGSILSESTVLDFDYLGEELNEHKGNKNLDPIYKNPKTGAVCYVGNIYASQDRKTLNDFNISAIVNCTSAHENSFEGKKSKVTGNNYSYLRFEIASWQAKLGRRPKPQKTLEYVNGLLDFVEEHLSNGQSVLLHCLAGAHRAGTAGVIVLMSKHFQDRDNAIALAKSFRPIIDPISQLYVLLQFVDRARKYTSKQKSETFTLGRHFQKSNEQDGEVVAIDE